MLILICVLLPTLMSANPLIVDDQTQEIVAARCYSKCLQIFIRFKSSKHVVERPNITSVTNPGINPPTFVDEIAQHLLVTQSLLQSCLEDVHNQCSRQCFKTCTTMTECICQQNDAGCLLACYFRKEMSKEGTQDDCPVIATVEESSLKVPFARCPKTCKSKSDCQPNQQCCTTDTCGPICLHIDGPKLNLPKYTPTLTQSSTHSNIEFDWTDTFTKFLKDESPLVFILQTRTCLCNKFLSKYVTPWQTLIMTHRLGAKLNALDNGTIYQFRLAAVSPHGSNGFGSISPNLPTVISKPYPPFPPESLMESKWKVTDDNLFQVEIKWDEPKPSSWRSYEYLLSWMVDHGMSQNEGEHMASLTQYTKVVPGAVHYNVIDNMKPSTTYKIQIMTKTDWPGYGDILSDPRTMYVTTPATITAENISENFKINSEMKECACPDHKTNQDGIIIRPPIFINGHLQVTVHLEKYADYIVSSYPEVCINYLSDNNAQNQKRFVKSFKQISELTLDNLQFNCRYSLEITTLSKTLTTITYHLCFCTPPCQKSYQEKNCPSDDISVIPSPTNVKFSLFNYDTMTYKVTWEQRVSRNQLSTKRKPDIIKYRILWAPRKFEPVPLDHYNDGIGFEPLFDSDRSDVRIVRSNITRLLLSNLTKDQLYIVRIQSLAVSENGQLLESHPIVIFLPTHGYTEIYYHNSQRRLVADLACVVIVLRLIHQIIRLLQFY